MENKGNSLYNSRENRNHGGMNFLCENVLYVKGAVTSIITVAYFQYSYSNVDGISIEANRVNLFSLDLNMRPFA